MNVPRATLSLENIRPWRWILLLVFVPGFIGPIGELQAVDGTYWLSNLTCMGACALLLTRLHRPLAATLWIWTLLAIFISGYFVKTYVIASDIRYWTVDAEYFYQLKAVLTTNLVAAGFRWIAIAFVLFCVVAWALPTVPTDRQEMAVERPRPLLVNVWRITCVVLVVSAVVAVARFVYGVGIHGVVESGASSRLPFRLGTLIVRTEEGLLPAICLLLVWVADRSGSARLITLALSVTFFNALLTSVVSTSKGAVLFQFEAPVLLLSVLTGQLTRRRILMLVSTTMLVVVLFPVLMRVRDGQVARRGTASVRELVALGSQSFSSGRRVPADNDTGFDRQVQIAGQKFLMRVTGADGVWMCLNRPSLLGSGVSALIDGESISAYYGRAVVGRNEAGTYDAPGLIGAFMLLGGRAAVWLLVPITLVLVWLTWRAISRLSTHAVAQALTAVFLFGFLSEGTLRPQNVIAVAVAVMLCEWVYRQLLVASEAQPSTQPSDLLGSREVVSGQEHAT